MVTFPLQSTHCHFIQWSILSPFKININILVICPLMIAKKQGYVNSSRCDPRWSKCVEAVMHSEHRGTVQTSPGNSSYGTNREIRTKYQEMDSRTLSGDLLSTSSFTFYNWTHLKRAIMDCDWRCFLLEYK